MKMLLLKPIIRTVVIVNATIGALLFSSEFLIRDFNVYVAIIFFIISIMCILDDSFNIMEGE